MNAKYHWSRESWGSDYPPKNADEIISAANETIDVFAETHDETECELFSQRLWERYCLEGRI